MAYVIINDVFSFHKVLNYRRENREIAPCIKVSYFCILHGGVFHVLSMVNSNYLFSY